MHKHQLAKDFIKYALLFLACIFLGVIIIFTFGMLWAGLLSTVPHFLAPHDSGLSDHIRYAETVGAMLGLVLYVAYLVYLAAKKMSRTAMPWIVAALTELTLLLVSLADRSLGHAPYIASGYAVTWLQLVVLVPLIVGYFYVSAVVQTSKRTKHR